MSGAGSHWPTPGRLFCPDPDPTQRVRLLPDADGVGSGRGTRGYCTTPARPVLPRKGRLPDAGQRLCRLRSVMCGWPQAPSRRRNLAAATARAMISRGDRRGPRRGLSEHTSALGMWPTAECRHGPPPRPHTQPRLVSRRFVGPQCRTATLTGSWRSLRQRKTAAVQPNVSAKPARAIARPPPHPP